MKKHTPGPWEAHKCREGIAILHPLKNREGDLGGYHVVVSERQLSPEGISMKLNERDAALIASAPELLEACKYVLSCCPENRFTDRHGMLSIVKNAIKKAEGK